MRAGEAAWQDSRGELGSKPENEHARRSGTRREPPRSYTWPQSWGRILLDDQEPLAADLLLAIRAAFQGPARGAVASATKSFQDAVDITFPRPVKTEDISRYLELVFGNTFEPLLESAEGKVRLQCTRRRAT